MRISAKGIALIKSFESLSLTAYLCQAGKWTIGYGATFYQNGKPVKAGDKITLSQAEALLAYHLAKFEKEVLSLVKTKITQSQFDALVSFAFNCGSDIDADTIAEGLGDSTLLKKVNANPQDPAITAEFNKWIKANGKPSNGLIRRRKAEVQLYFSHS